MQCVDVGDGDGQANDELQDGPGDQVPGVHHKGFIILEIWVPRVHLVELGQKTIVNCSEDGGLRARLQADIADESELHDETVVDQLRPQLPIRL